ncbi:MAG: M23 family metallopeptidase [Methylobacillus sp.]|nr:M23 family metallopeptidase [Methylobacillus sp.]
MQEEKAHILAQIQPSQERKLRLRWLLALTTLPLFGVITAFGIAPQSSAEKTENVAVREVIEELTLPDSAPTVAQVALQSPLWQTDTVRKDDTLGSLLNRLNIRNSEAIAFLRQSPDARALASKLRPGRSISAQTTTDGQLLELQYRYDGNTALVVKLDGENYTAQSLTLTPETRTELKSADIRSSLFAATDAAGIPDAVAMQLVQIFSSDIDFHLDLRQGDHFRVIYEVGYANGEQTASGQVLAAEFINQGKTYSAVLYRDADGHAEYFTPEGKPLRKSFLRSPLEFSRISSGFSTARLHPVLNTLRAHKGVDYAAPTGTPVKTTADGTVLFVGQQNGYGNVIILRHAGDISTVYGHLSRFAADLKKGQRVSQGDIIGYVGMTGLATGPHLHYEFRVHDKQVDPLQIALPELPKTSVANLEDFKQQSQRLRTQLTLLENLKTAAVE